MTVTPAGVHCLKMGIPLASIKTQTIADANNPQLLVMATDDNGNLGVGETWWGTYQPTSQPGSPVRPIASMIDDVLAPACIGWDGDDISGLGAHLHRLTYQYGPEGVTSSAIAGIDLALWDLRAQNRGVPAAQLLGPRAHDRLPAYASLDWLGTAQGACVDAKRAVESGFIGVKLHEAEAEIVLAVREAIGPDIALMVDISARLDDAAAATLAESVQRAGVTWLEEPIFPYQAHGRLARLRASIQQRLAAGENEFSVAGIRRLLESGAVNVLQPDIVKFGGLSAANELGRLALEHQVWLCPHNFSLGPSLGANIHWSMTAGAATWIEVPFLSAGQRFAGKWDMPTLVDGYIHYPTTVGLGWD